MSCERGQKYILNEDDILLPNIVTEDNKDNLIAGGLFDSLTVDDSNATASINCEDRTLSDTAAVPTLNWDAACLLGDWCVAGDLSVSGNLNAVLSGGDIDWSGTDTDSIVEGDNNYYLTKSRMAQWVDDLIVPEAPLNKELTEVGGVYSLGLTINAVSGLVITDNVIHVSPAGTDTRELEDSRYDFAKPFKTISAAAATATSGDLILVRPGTYTNESDLLSNGVNYYFQPGAKVVQQTGVISEPLFVDSGAVTCEVRGFGEFINEDSSVTEVLRITNSSSNIIFEAKLIQTNATSAAKYAVRHENGYLRLVCESIISNASGVLVSDAGILYIKNTYVRAGTGPAVKVTASDVTLSLDNCQVEATALTAAALYLDTAFITTAVSLRNSVFVVPTSGVNYTIITNASDTPSVITLPGNCANKGIHTDISLVQPSSFAVDTSVEINYV
jgi:hypothetical protein